MFTTSPTMRRVVPRLLFVVNDAAFFTSHRLPLAVGAREAGYDVAVATGVTPAAERIRDAGFAWHGVALSRSGTSPLGEAKTVLELTKLYRELRPDVVHHVTAKPILYGGIAALTVGVPSVVHAISGLGYAFISRRPKAQAIRAVIKNGYRLVTSHRNCAVIFQNQDDRAVFGDAIRTPNIVMIPGSGVDRTKFRPTPLPEGLPVVLLPSRMLWDKGILELVQAARRVNATKKRARFVLVGGTDDGNPTTIPSALLREWVNEGVIEWWGHRNDMERVLVEATIVCLPSYREGFPKSLLEACAAGRPIVTTDVAGCRDAVSGGDHGVLVPARDAVALAEAIGALLDDEPRIKRMAAAAAVASERFDVRRVVDTTVSLYASLRQSSGAISGGAR